LGTGPFDQPLAWDRQAFRHFGHSVDLYLPEAAGLWRAIISPDGSIWQIRPLADVVIDPRPDKKILLGVNWDITQLPSLTAELASRHAWMRVTLRSIWDAVIATDAHGVVALAAGTILISRDGQHYGIEDSAAPIWDDKDQTVGVVVVFRDVTAERRLKGRNGLSCDA
jgi:PAS domain-containing protein